ncbi:hypothetical protein IEQ34_018718 [Dendrobium chrysotoxum]|uniref:Uncharacterized protein n=1 Tax=Dendrobium chrysotoxum TaxID=161865 RepID=A0AAV7G5Z6_DENCH|nr:hypothetical protein IEQ34_018718 [Dendrobium chrysotoxum]
MPSLSLLFLFDLRNSASTLRLLSQGASSSMVFLELRATTYLGLPSLWILENKNEALPSPFEFTLIGFLFDCPLRTHNAMANGTRPLVAHVLVKLDITKHYPNKCGLGQKNSGETLCRAYVLISKKEVNNGHPNIAKEKIHAPRDISNTSKDNKIAHHRVTPIRPRAPKPRKPNRNDDKRNNQQNERSLHQNAKQKKQETKSSPQQNEQSANDRDSCSWLMCKRDQEQTKENQHQ